ncbi:hypothetical protein [Aquipuribacter sp. MA13-6]|uniref:hypothetical protein n=1 Tax=unclassified Aquipuribacter TaxID=2635084 RepID=UPI003EEA42AB
MPAGLRPPPRRGPLVARLLALGLVGVLTGVLGSAVHLTREPVLGLLVPYGVVLAVALVLATDVAVAAATVGRHRPGPGASLLAVGLGRGLLLGLLLLPRPAGDLVLTGLPASTAWILLSVLVPSFAAPMTVALGTRSRLAPARAGALAVP